MEKRLSTPAPAAVTRGNAPYQLRPVNVAVPGEVRTIQVCRPDSLRVDAQQSDADSGGLIFYGKAITQFEAIIRG